MVQVLIKNAATASAVPIIDIKTSGVASVSNVQLENAEATSTGRIGIKFKQLHMSWIRKEVMLFLMP